MAGTAAAAFLKQHPRFHKCPENGHILVKIAMADSWGVTIESLNKAYRKAKRLKLLK